MDTSTPPPLTQNGDKDHPVDGVVDSSAPKTKIAPPPSADGTPKQRLKEQIQDFININSRLEERLIELERQMKDKDEKILKLEMTQSQSKARTSSAADNSQIQKAIKAATEEQEKKIEKLQKQLQEKEKAAKKAEQEASKKAGAELTKKLEEMERKLGEAEEENKRLRTSATNGGTEGGSKVPSIVPKLNFANIKAGKEEFTPPPAARGRPERTPNTGGSQTDRTHNRNHVYQLSSRLEQLATPRMVTPKAESKTSTTPRNLNASTSPGPGQYSTYSPLEDTFQRRNSYVFVSKSPRFKDAKDSPGPGQYSAQADAPKNPTPGMVSKSPRFRKDDTVSPGPCAYDGDKPAKRPASAASTPFKSKADRDPMKTGVYGNKGTGESPGPARYTRPGSAPVKTAGHVFKSKVSRFKEERKGKDSPGPGAYDKEEKVEKSKASAAYKSTTPRFPKAKTRAPDMTKYDANNDSIGDVAEKAGRRPSAAFASKNDRFTKR